MWSLVDFLYLVETETPYSQYINANSPRIGIVNYANQSNVSDPYGTSLSTNQPYLATLVSMDEKWRSVNSADHRFVFEVDDSVTIDYVAFAGHRGIIGRQVGIDIYNKGFLVQTVTDFMFTTERAVFKLFAAVACDKIIIHFSSDELFDMEVGYISIGQSVALPRRIYVGHAPMPYCRDVKTRFVISDNSAFLGQEVTSIGLKNSVDLSNVPPDYYRDIIFPYFQKPAETQPFFFAWRPSDYPDEIGLCWLPNGSVRVSNEKPNGFMSFGFDMIGYVNEY